MALYQIENFLKHDKPEGDMFFDELDEIVHSDVGTNAVDLSDVAPISPMASASGIIFYSNLVMELHVDSILSSN